MKKTHEEKAVVTRFQTVQSGDSEYSTSLPKRNPELIKTRKDILKSLKITHNYWLAVFDQKKVIQALKEYVATPEIERKQKTKLKHYLKEIRKTAFDFYSTTGTPENLRIFSTQLGKANDGYTMKQGTKRARRILLLLESNDLSSFSFTPAPLSTAQEKINSMKSKIESAVSKTTLLVPVYHEVRKDLRHMKYLFQIAAVQNTKSPELHQTHHFLSVLNSQLGKVHDQYAKLKLTDEPKYMQTQMQIPPDLQKKIRLFYSNQ